ncbi:hypothetical protein BAE40_08915 [Mesorhizobium loti]|uniref:Uncharacterized protein n=1 Tax=Rhizobium loti TaxID=381 RepID=A0A1A5JVE7_RHILI|nr:hypothetical protein BAE39_09135 [Mesorhizobium loti]OBP93428.1 hypothetical protein BAE38_09145 [Mesorhizobium loti]OBP95400.1 hypothetical protein BAE40_08915 [Mesorhizobium loti]
MSGLAIRANIAVRSPGHRAGATESWHPTSLVLIKNCAQYYQKVGRRQTSQDCEGRAQPLQDAAWVVPRASSMRRRMVSAQRPHLGLQPRRLWIWLVERRCSGNGVLFQKSG